MNISIDLCENGFVVRVNYNQQFIFTDLTVALAKIQWIVEHKEEFKAPPLPGNPIHCSG